MTDPALETGPRPLSQERARLAILVRIAATAGSFSRKLGDAVDRATDAEIRILADLVERGMSIPALVSFLQGAHVIVGDGGLYHRWIFPTSHQRLSSHHRTVDKKATPDYGLDGPLVREALYGSAAMGTWVQLERSATNYRFGQRLTLDDLAHIRDYVIYRITGMNVGPWGLSAHVDTRPMVLRPPESTAGRGAADGLAAFTRQALGGDRHADRRWHDVLSPAVPAVGPAGHLFTPALPEHPEELLPDEPYLDELGLGLFGGLPIVRATATLRPGVLAILDAPPPPVQLAPLAGGSEVVEVAMGKRRLTLRATVLPERGLGTGMYDIEEGA